MVRARPRACPSWNCAVGPARPGLVPEEVAPMARVIVDEIDRADARLVELGLSYLSRPWLLDAVQRSGDRRVHRPPTQPDDEVLTSTNRPSACTRLTLTVSWRSSVSSSPTETSVVVVDILRARPGAADHLIEIGPGAGADGGRRHLPWAYRRPPCPRFVSAHMAGLRRVERVAGESGRGADVGERSALTWKPRRYTRCSPERG